MIDEKAVTQRIRSLMKSRNDTFASIGKDDRALQTRLSRQINQGTALTFSTLAAVLEHYDDVSVSWLLTGEETEVREVQKKDGAPYFDVDFLGGFGEIFNDQTTTPSAYITAPLKAQMWVNVTGHSMEPEISHGDIIALREVGIEDIQYGEIYAVVLDNFRTIKTLRKGSEKGLMRFVPSNKEYDEQEFPIKRVKRVFEVVGSMKKFF